MNTVKNKKSYDLKNISQITNRDFKKMITSFSVCLKWREKVGEDRRRGDGSRNFSIFWPPSPILSSPSSKHRIKIAPTTENSKKKIFKNPNNRHRVPFFKGNLYGHAIVGFDPGPHPPPIRIG